MTMAERRRIAYFSPLPPTRSGIADYSYELLPSLAGCWDLTLFVASPEDTDPKLQRQFAIEPVENYPAQRWQYDTALYQMGNSSHHEKLYQMACRYPGIVVLHDYILHHFVAHHTAGQGQYPAYARELLYTQDGNNLKQVRALYQEGQVEHLQKIPLNQRLLDLNLGILVHSSHVRRQLLESRPRLPIHLIPALITLYPAEPCRHLLPWPEESVIFGSFGQITTAKRLDQALQAFAEVHQQLPHTRYLIVGEQLPEVELNQMVDNLELRDAVYCTGYSETLQQFVDWIATVDVVVNLRAPTLGETSAAALRALAGGKPLIVYDHGWYRELPDNTVVKVPVLDHSALVAAMVGLAQEPEWREQMGNWARSYSQAQHSPDKAAESYRQAVESILGFVHSGGAYA